MVRKNVNPDTITYKGGFKAESYVDEKIAAKMPQVGVMPTGKKAAKKHKFV